MHHRVFASAACAGLALLALPAYADGEYDIAVDSSYVFDPLATEVSDLPGIALTATYGIGDYIYLEGWGRRSFADPKISGDAELDLGGGFEVPLVAGITLDAYAGYWMYGEELDTNDTVLEGGLSWGGARVYALSFEGESETAAYGLTYDATLGDTLTLTPRVVYIEAYDATNYALVATYAFTDAWRLETGGVYEEVFDEEESSEYEFRAFLRIARAFSAEVE